MDIRITIDYVSLKNYKEVSFKDVIKYWVFNFRKYKFVKGFILRVFGIDFNIREGNATFKMIRMVQQRNTEVAERKTPQL